MIAFSSKPVETVALSNPDSEIARDSSRTIADFVNGDEYLFLAISRTGGERVETKVPAQALSLLSQILAEMSKGNPITLIPRETELTTHEAAAIMRVSRPYLIKILEEGKIAFRKVGAHRRVRYRDLVAYMEAEKDARKAVLDEMTAEAQRLGLYE